MLAAVYIVIVIIGAIVGMGTLGATAPEDADAPADERERNILIMLLVLGSWFFHSDGHLLFHLILGRDLW